MSDIVREKRQLRAEVIARRDAIDAEALVKRSEDACDELFDYVESVIHVEGTIAVFAAFGTELQLDSFVFRAASMGCPIAYPVLVAGPTGTSMEFVRIPVEEIEQRCEIIENPLRKWSHEELDGLPEGYEVLDPYDIDCVVVPLVAFDEEGRRLGYGGGFYDRFLDVVRDDTMIVGVAFEEQRIDAVPCEPFDHVLPCVVTA